MKDKIFALWFASQVTRRLYTTNDANTEWHIKRNLMFQLNKLRLGDPTRY